MLPTATVLTVLALVKFLSGQCLLFASLAASSFLIYLEIQHSTNEVKSRVISHMIAATIGGFTYLILEPGYPSAETAIRSKNRYY
ncbi:HPP family protein [Microcoleus vaginatus]|uniref:HPP family protein n=1 Tax=Microcoleus vaginatus TaxID=119532 RepID=UPI00403F9989